MLKLFYKTLLISVLSCSLLTMDFNSKGLSFNSAQAETFKTETISDSDMMATLTMGVIGILTSRLWMCKMTADMMVAAAGGAAFVAGEIISTFELKKAMKELEMQIERDKNGNINREQIAQLERLRESYVKAKEIANTKKMLQQAAAAAFAVATAVAYTLEAAEEAAKKACEATLKTAGTCQGLTPMTTATAGVLFGLFSTRLAVTPSNAGFATQTGNEATEKASESSTESAAKSLAASYTSTCSLPYGAGAWACPLIAPCQTAGAIITPGCASVTPVLKQTSGFCPAPLSLTQTGHSKTELYANKFSKPQITIAKLIIAMLKPNDAKAELFTAMGIASSAAISFLLETSKTLGPMIDSYLLAPKNRAIIWGILAGLTYAASSATDHVIAQIDSNITKIDAILNSMYQMSNGATATQLAQRPAEGQLPVRLNSVAHFNSNKYGEIDLTKNGGGSLPCYTGSDTAKCKAFDDSIKDNPSFASLNGESQKQVQSILSAANGINGASKITSGTLQSLGAVAGSAGALKSAMDKANKKAADDLKKSGSKIGLDDQTKKFSDSVNKSIKDALKKSNSTSSAMYASMYGGKNVIASASTSTAADAEAAARKAAEEASEVARRKAMAAGNVVDMSSTASTKSDDLAVESTTAASQELSTEELAKLNAAQKDVARKSADGLDLKNDISTDKTASLFDLISKRYLQSGYPRLFKKKELKEDETTTPLKN